MTTATVAIGNRTMDTEMVWPRRSLEELVDRLMAAMFGDETEKAEPNATRAIHEARRLRQAGDIDGGLAVLAGTDAAKATSEGGSMGLLRVDADGETAVRGPGGHGLQPGHGKGGCARSPRQRDA